MTDNKPDTKLDECIYVAEKVIPADLCDAIVQDIETRKWEPHTWYNSSTDSTHSNDRELDFQLTTMELQKELSPKQFLQNLRIGEVKSLLNNG